MVGSHTTLDPMAGLRDLATAEVWGLDVGKVLAPPRRFEVAFFASEGYQAVEAMHRSGFQMGTIGASAVVKWFGPFARKYVDDPRHGCPFLTSSSMMEARPRAEKLVSVRHTKHLSALKVYENDILISCSGTIGNVALCTKDVDGWACSQDAIRVTARQPDDLGPLYCFLQSPLGQFLLKKSETGSVVRHIYEADVSSLPIPRLPRALRQELTRLVKEASVLRVEANRHLDQAEAMVQSQLGLPDIEDFLKLRQVDKQHGACVFASGAGTSILAQHAASRMRLDATAHDPAANALRDWLRRQPRAAVMGSYLAEVRNSSLRKRVYVEDGSFGVPLLGGKQLMLIRPGEVNYLSKVLTKNLRNEAVHAGWTLISCGGTVGRTLFVHRNHENVIFTQDVMRLVPRGNCSPGYIYAYLSSPYGQIQLQQASYGSVQKKLRDLHFVQVDVCIPIDTGQSVHDVVVRGFNARADALDAETRAFATFMNCINLGREAVEASWGKEY